MSGGNSHVPELVDPLGGGQVFQAVLAEVAQLELDERSGGGRDEHLAAVARRRRSARRGGRRPDVALVGKERRARVQADADADRPGGELLRASPPRPRALPGAVGKAKKKASPCVSTSTPPSAAQASRITRRCSASASAYALGAQLVQQLGRALDVREEERDGAGDGRSAAQASSCANARHDEAASGAGLHRGRVWFRESDRRTGKRLPWA